MEPRHEYLARLRRERAERTAKFAAEHNPGISNRTYLLIGTAVVIGALLITVLLVVGLWFLVAYLRRLALGLAVVMLVGVASCSYELPDRPPDYHDHNYHDCARCHNN